MARTPGSNTVAYFPLKENAIDTAHNINLTSYGTTSYTEVGGVKSAQFTKSNWLYNNNVSYVPQGDTPKTLSVWLYIKGNNTWRTGVAGMGGITNNTFFGLGLYQGTTNLIMTRYGSTSGTYTPTLNTWLNAIITYSNSSWKMYINGELKLSWSATAPTSGNRVYLGQNPDSTATSDTFYGNMSNIILEKVARTETEIQSYFNSTAWQYGLAPKPTILYGSSSIKEMYYGTGVDVWDTQGPAPDGYHVPTNTEWQAVYDMGVALGQWSSSNGDGMRIKLKMPFAGQRDYSSSNVNNQGSNANYWASTAYSITGFSYRLRFLSDGLSPQSNSRCSNGFSLRCFKNSPLIPNSSWTTIYEGTGGAGIYHNASEGVISISSDGTNWITIADKNLGATQVYNDGDTLSEANCGKYYQRGNNYGFPRTGTISKKSLKTVNASAYGPLNYYNSDTWITVSSWDSSDNRNLRGGVSQGVNPLVKTIKAVYYGSNKIRPASRLPSAYQEVEWIGTTGTQWIDTGYVGNSNTGVKTKLQFNSATTSSNMFQVGNGAYRCEYYTSPYLVQILYNNGSSVNGQIKIGLPISTPHTFVCNDEQHNWYVNGALEKSATTPVYVSNVNITLFSYSNGNRKASGRIWYFQIYDGKNIVRDLVPCYRKSDNVVGMYDLVNNTFYTNAGTGTFTKGANVN